jgi:predicted CXXCH cytochrome family protein
MNSSSHWTYLAFSLLVAPAVCFAGMHPARVDARSNCMECHSDLGAGAYLHPALKQGCTACHVVENRDDSTYVVLKPAKTALCADCHQPEQPLRAHFPYASAMCLRCHNPHSASDSRLLRASVNDLCLECHLRTANSAASQYMPMISLSVNNSMGHPYERHPVSGVPDPLTGKEMSCSSCHLAHGGTMLHYLKMGSEIPADALNHNVETNDMCHKCHLRLWGLDGSAAKKKKKK